MTKISDATPAPLRPQTPVKPYPYREEEVSYRGAAPDVRLAATLTLPEGEGPFPAVLLIAGAGPHNRDEELNGHAIFLVLADHLTRQGVAVLRFDKRGVGQSTGDHVAATTLDFAADAGAGVTYLRDRPEVDASRIGLIGHSEGGLIAPIVAADDPGVAFAVLMAGPGAPGHRILAAQTKAAALVGGAEPAAADEVAAFQSHLLDAVMAAEDQTSAELAVRTVMKSVGVEGAAVDGTVETFASPWFRFFIAHDPAPTLKMLRIPVLALVGSKDMQVLAALNIPALREALADDPRAEVVELEGVNHNFQNAPTGATSEYGQIEETLSPAFLKRITDWIFSTGSLMR